MFLHTIFNKVKAFDDLHGSFFYFFKRWFYNLVGIKKSQIIYVYASRKNVGDYLSYRGIRTIFNIQGLECFASPEAISELQFFIKILKKTRKKPILIIGGGGLFQEVFDPFWECILKKNILFIVFGIGMNKLTGYRKPTKSSLLKSIIRNASYIQVRDKMTQKHIKNLTDISVPIGICPSVNYIYPRYWCNKLEGNKVLLHVIHPFDISVSSNSSNFLETVRLYLQKVADQYGLIYKEETNISLNTEKVLKKFYNARLVISSRLHGCIISYAMGVPFIPLACDDKIASFLETYLPDVHPLKTKDLVDFNLLREIVNEGLVRKINYQDRLKKYVQTNIKEANKVKNLIFSSF